MVTPLEEVTLLEALRRDRGLSAPEVGAALGISQKTIRSYERLRWEPTAKPLELLADFYGVRPSVLLDDIRKHMRARDAREARRVAA